MDGFTTFDIFDPDFDVRYGALYYYFTEMIESDKTGDEYVEKLADRVKEDVKEYLVDWFEEIYEGIKGDLEYDFQYWLNKQDEEWVENSTIDEIIEKLYSEVTYIKNDKFTNDILYDYLYTRR